MEQDIIYDVKRLAYEVLKDEDIITSENFDFNNSDKFDSVNRVAILAALEKEYDFIFKLREISSWNTVNELAAIVETKL